MSTGKGWASESIEPQTSQSTFKDKEYERTQLRRWLRDMVAKKGEHLKGRYPPSIPSVQLSADTNTHPAKHSETMTDTNMYHNNGTRSQNHDAEQHNIAQNTVLHEHLTDLLQRLETSEAQSSLIFKDFDHALAELRQRLNKDEEHASFQAARLHDVSLQLRALEVHLKNMPEAQVRDQKAKHNEHVLDQTQSAQDNLNRRLEALEKDHLTGSSSQKLQDLDKAQSMLLSKIEQLETNYQKTYSIAEQSFDHINEILEQHKNTMLEQEKHFETLSHHIQSMSRHLNNVPEQTGRETEHDNTPLKQSVENYRTETEKSFKDISKVLGHVSSCLGGLDARLEVFESRNKDISSPPAETFMEHITSRLDVSEQRSHEALRKIESVIENFDTHMQERVHNLIQQSFQVQFEDTNPVLEHVADKAVGSMNRHLEEMKKDNLVAFQSLVHVMERFDQRLKTIEEKHSFDYHEEHPENPEHATIRREHSTTQEEGYATFQGYAEQQGPSDPISAFDRTNGFLSKGQENFAQEQQGQPFKSSILRKEITIPEQAHFSSPDLYAAHASPSRQGEEEPGEQSEEPAFLSSTEQASHHEASPESHKPERQASQALHMNGYAYSQHAFTPAEESVHTAQTPPETMAQTPSAMLAHDQAHEAQPENQNADIFRDTPNGSAEGALGTTSHPGISQPDLHHSFENGMGEQQVLMPETTPDNTNSWLASTRAALQQSSNLTPPQQQTDLPSPPPQHEAYPSMFDPGRTSDQNSSPLPESPEATSPQQAQNGLTRKLLYGFSALVFLVCGVFLFLTIRSEADNIVPPPARKEQGQENREKATPKQGKQTSLKEIRETDIAPDTSPLSKPLKKIVATDEAQPQPALRKGLNNKDPLAQYQWALKNTEQKNLKTAFSFMEKAAQANLPPAQYKLALMYEKGEGHPKDGQKALFWLRRAAEGGNRLAMYHLGYSYAAGVHISRDHKKAARWFEKSALLGLPDAQFNLAQLYELGGGVPKNLKEAYAWYRLAARSGDMEAKNRARVLALELSPSQRRHADTLVQRFRPKPLKKEANGIFGGLPGQQG